VAATGHTFVDMTGLAPVDAAPARLCVETVRSCDVYVGLLGMRYGSPVRDQPGQSYTELEIDTAGQTGMDRLVFLIDTESDDLGIPPNAFLDREYRDRQDAFRRRVGGSGLTAHRFASPDDLARLVERSLRGLAATRQRIDSGIEQARQARPSPAWGSRFVNPAPMTAPTWFQERDTQTRRLTAFLGDPRMRMMTVTGQAGASKTALVCRLLNNLEQDQDPGADLAGMGGFDIVYLSPNGRHLVDYPNLVGDLCSLLPAELAKRVQWLYQDPRNGPTQVMSALLEAFPVHDRVVVFLDGLESIMDTQNASLTDRALHEALVTVLGAPEHAIKVITTTVVAPTGLLQVAVPAQDQLWLDECLRSPDAEDALRALDPDGAIRPDEAPAAPGHAPVPPTARHVPVPDGPAPHGPAPFEPAPPHVAPGTRAPVQLSARS